jgi:hypothetical protein
LKEWRKTATLFLAAVIDRREKAMPNSKYFRVKMISMIVGILSFLPTFAYVVTITPGTKALFLQVGNGTFTGTYSGGGTPGNNATVNQVSVTVSANVLGNGTSQSMTTNSTQTASPYDNFTFCAVPAQTYVGGFFRIPSGTSSAILSVTSPASLTNGAGDSIAFNRISWVSGGVGDAIPTIPSGTFTGATQTLYTFASNTWAESCLAFKYANSSVVPPGTYTGRVTYTLSAP